MSENKQVLPKPRIRIDEFGDIIPLSGNPRFVRGDFYDEDQMKKAIEAAVLSASAEAVNKELLAAAIEALSACNSVSRSSYREVKREGWVGYIQTEEWCKWLENDIAKQLHSAIAKAEGQS